MMIFKLKVFSVLTAVFIFLGILYLIRKRKLREEFSIIWIIAGILFLIVAFFEGIIIYISNLLGILTPQATLFFFGIIFLILLNLQLSIKASRLIMQIKNLAQKLALKENEIDELKRRISLLEKRKKG